MEYGSECARGAEATITEGMFIGREVMVKHRPPKGYRIPELDSRIRSSRTRSEARLMHEARLAGVRTPCIFDIDLKESTIVMERIRGTTVKDVLDSDPGRADEICRMIGAEVAKMHSARICHGDLTTSNMIMTDDGSLCIIDFSMGCSRADVEEMGVDIRLLERAFTSAHTDIVGSLDVLMDAYYAGIPNPDAVRKKVEDIKNRGRYT